MFINFKKKHQRFLIFSGVHTVIVFHAFLLQDNTWTTRLDDSVNEVAMAAFDMTFIIGQKSYEGYEYYDFFEQVFERLRERPFWSNLTSERQAGINVFRRKLNERRTVMISSK